MPTCELLIREAVEVIAGDSPRLDAELLLSRVTGWSRTSFRAWPERQVPAAEAAHFRQLVGQRTAGHPVAHLLGEQGFWTLALKVSEATLIPRPDTECLIEAALELPLPDTAQVVDLGTGTGAIALALASERPRWQVMASDAVPAAVELARHNASRLDLSVVVHCSHWFDALPEARFDLVISNPPYIADSDQHLEAGDVRFEPRTALVSGADGLDAIRHIIGASPGRLKAGGWLMLEHGYDQASQVRSLFSQAGFVTVTTHRDYGNRDRLTYGQFPG